VLKGAEIFQHNKKAKIFSTIRESHAYPQSASR